MIYASICSGIESATLAWEPLGWEAAWFAEIEKFPSAVLAERWSGISNHGDFTQITKSRPIDVLVAGTPCQSFSLAGRRLGLADPRGNLTLEWLRLVDRLLPRWIVWENVPGVLSDDGGRTFGAVLGALGEFGYGVAYRVLDAQYFGLAQRRKRVFVVGCLGDWRRAAAVLFERESLCGHPAPSRETGAIVAALTTNGVGTCGADDNQAQGGHLISFALNAKGGSALMDGTSETFITHPLRAGGFDASEAGTGRGTPIIPILEAGKRCGEGDSREGVGVGSSGDPMYTLQAGAQHAVALPFDPQQITSRENRSNPSWGDVSATLAGQPPAVALNLRGREGGSQAELSDVASLRAASGGSSRSYVVNARQTPISSIDLTGPIDANGYSQAVSAGYAVRRLTPVEAERLQGMPDGHTLVTYRGKPAADGPRYRAIGNAMAVPVMSWIGQRIATVEGVG